MLDKHMLNMLSSENKYMYIIIIIIIIVFAYTKSRFSHDAAHIMLIFKSR